MSAGLTFLSWVRQGLGTGAASPDPLHGPLPARPSIGVGVRLNQRPEVPLSARLHGPGDVTGLDPRQLIRTEPAANTRDADPNVFAAAEFDRPDLPWVLTPARAAERDRLRPWLVLVVVDAASATVEPSADGPLPVLHCGREELPDLAESWAWAHAQLATEGALADEVLDGLLAYRPERSLSRLICPRRLRARCSYLACVVPAFEAGCKAGLGLALDAADEAQLRPAWNPGNGQAPPLPVYHHWEFTTGEAENFEALAGRLTAQPLSETVGLRNLDISRPDPGLPELVPELGRGVLGLEGALRAPAAMPTAWRAEDRVAFETALAPLLEVAPDRLAPPLYGGAHASRRRVPADGGDVRAWGTQRSWRWCSKCQGLWWEPGQAQANCPEGGQHSSAGSGDYSLVHQATPTPADHQAGWRWCSKCHGLWWGPGQAQSNCPEGGQHSQAGSGDYALAHSVGAGQPDWDWRWCHKCHGLWWGPGQAQSNCPEGGQHSSTGSGNYRLPVGREPRWLRQLNLDPRHRAAAAFGAQVVQQHQEALMASAWEQAAQVRRANDALRQGQLARTVTDAFYRRRLGAAGRTTATTLPDDRLMQVTAAAQDQVALGEDRGPVGAEMRRNPEAAAAVTPAFRSLTRPLGPLSRRLGPDRAARLPSPVLELAKRELTVNPALEAPEGMAAVGDLSSDKETFAALTPNRVQPRWWEGPPTGPTESPVPATPTVVDVGATMPNRVFTVGADGRVISRVEQEGGIGWQDHGAPPGTVATGGLAAIRDLHAFVGGADGKLWSLSWDADRWAWIDHGTPGVSLGGSPLGLARNYIPRPGGLAQTGDFQSVFMIGGGKLFERAGARSSWRWIDHDRPGAAWLTGVPGTADPWRILAVGMGEDAGQRRGALYERVWDGSQWRWIWRGSPGGEGLRSDFPAIASATSFYAAGYSDIYVGGTAGSFAAKHSGKVLDIAWASGDNGAQLHQWDWNRGDNQRFRLEPLGDGTHRLVAHHSGRVLDVAGASRDNGARIVQWDWHGGDNQRFRLEALGDDTHRLVAKHSGKVLDVDSWPPWSAGDNGRPLQQWDWNGGDHQRFRLDTFPAWARLGAPEAVGAGLGRTPDGGLWAAASASAKLYRGTFDAGFGSWADLGAPPGVSGEVRGTLRGNTPWVARGEKLFELRDGNQWIDHGRPAPGGAGAPDAAPPAHRRWRPAVGYMSNLVVAHVDNPGGQRRAYYRVGRDLDFDTAVRGGWELKTMPGAAGEELPGAGVGPKGCGVALADLDKSGRDDLVLAWIEKTPLGYFASYRVGANIDGNGNVAGWRPPKRLPTPISTNFGSSGGLTASYPPQGADIAIGDLDGDGTLDMVVAYGSGQPKVDNVYYRVGWALDPDAVATRGWTESQRVPWPERNDPGTRPAVVGTGLAIVSLAPEAQPRPSLIVMLVEATAQGLRASYRIGRDINARGNVVGGWSELKTIPGALGAAAHGAGLTVADFTGSQRPDLVVFHLEHTAQGNRGWYRIGWDLNAAGDARSWSEPRRVDDGGWFGASNVGGAIAVADFDNALLGRKRELAKRFGDAARDHQGLLQRRQALARADDAPRLAVPAVVGGLRTNLDAERTVTARVTARIEGVSLGGPGSAPDPLNPLVVAPSFPQPMYRFLAEQSQDLLLPGVEDVPAETVSLLRANPAFIEAFMVGLNHELGRELLWREFPGDRRATYFRQFWDTRSGVAGAGPLTDIPPIAEWRPAADLGKSATAVGGEDMVIMLVRGELLRRYPSTAIYARRAVWNANRSARVLADTRMAPQFQGALPPDLVFFGFPLTVSQARGAGADAGWFFVLEQGPTAPQFGMDVPGINPVFGRLPDAWSDLSWAHVAASAAALEGLVHVDLDAFAAFADPTRPARRAEENPQAPLTADPGAGGSTWAVSDGSGFPTSGRFRVRCEDEIALCTARSGNNLTVTRGIEGTLAAAHPVGRAVVHAPVLTWAWNSAQMAHILFQRPVEVAIHATDMLPVVSPSGARSGMATAT